MRTLASIQQIDKVLPAENSDNLELAIIGGWQCVIKKGEFKPGDLCVYFEIDSILPEDKDWAKFLESKKYRVKTIKLRGNLSQGLALPLSILPVDVTYVDGFSIGADMTNILGVKKWEPIIACEGGQNISKNRYFPSVVPKTDETRIQSAMKCLEELHGHTYYISVKCDGTSATYVNDGENGFSVCSRNNVREKDSNCIYWKMAEKYNIEDILTKYPTYAIQGEICGEGIQKNKLGLKEPDLFVFNVYDTERKELLTLGQMVAFCSEYGLKTVPILEAGNYFEYTLDELLAFAEGKYEGTDNEREGIVVRCCKEMWSEKLRGRLSFKVISNKFLLNEE